MDILGLWVAEHCDIGPDLGLKSGEAYTSYQFWARCSGLKCWSLVVFGRKMKERFASSRGAKGVVYSGVQMKRAAGVANPMNHTTIQKAKVVPLVRAAPV